MRTTERVTITLPAELARRLREAVATSDAGSASAFLRRLLEERLAEENLDAFLVELEARGGQSTRESRQWAQDVVAAVRAGERDRVVA